jgi:hypothetical protein
MGSDNRPHTGVCVVRVERQSTGCLYTVIVIPDLTRFTPGSQHHYALMEDALERIRRFLAMFDDGRAALP